MRKGMGLLGVLLTAGVVSAEKPSGLPADVRPDGTEPTPVARELHDVGGPGARPEPTAAVVDVMAAVREWVLARGIVPLGTVAVQVWE